MIEMLLPGIAEYQDVVYVYDDELSKYSENTSFIRGMNVAGAYVNPNREHLTRKCPYRVQNAVNGTESSSSRIWR